MERITKELETEAGKTQPQTAESTTKNAPTGRRRSVKGVQVTGKSKAIPNEIKSRRGNIPLSRKHSRGEI